MITSSLTYINESSEATGMIAKLTGTIDGIKPSECIIDVQGVGYLVHIPLSTFEKISGEKKVSLHIFTLHKEDTFRLYGFHSSQERELFALLLNISGIGPSMALSVLSWLSVERFVQAVAREDTSALVSVPGIGKAKAEKLFFEMKRKMKRLEELASPGDHRVPPGHDALEALISLGFDEKKALPAVDSILKTDPAMPLEKIIKEALRILS